MPELQVYKAFFASPYAPQYTWVRDCVSKACRQENIDLCIADEKTAPGAEISKEMEKIMQECNFGIVVASGLNPNAMYEYGYMKALSKPVLVLKDQVTTLPFDMAGNMAVPYEDPAKLDSSNTNGKNQVYKDALIGSVGRAIKDIRKQLSKKPPSTGIIPNAMKKRILFGYFCYEVEGFERILVRKNKINEWDFPIRTRVDSHIPIHQIVNKKVKGFLDKSNQRKRWFLDSGFEEPQIFEIYPSDKNSNKDERSAPLPVFFKVRVKPDAGIPSPEGTYCWASKSLLFRKMKLLEIQPGEIAVSTQTCQPAVPILLRYLRNNKILLEYGKKVLDCVDIIIHRDYKKSDEKGIESRFLLLHRKHDPDPSKNVRWEYPKGGLEYHESKQEGSIRELLEETGVDTIGMFRYGGTLDRITTDVSDRKFNYDKIPLHYDTLRLQCLSYKYLGDPKGINLSYEHDSYNWYSWRAAKTKNWLYYGKDFMEKWKDDESEINITAAPPVSLAFQVTEDCIHSCRYCHRRKASERPLKPESWRRLIDSLALRRILRITFTGGEPLLLGKEDIFGIIRYANDKRIHTCLSTTGIAGKDDRHRLNRKDLELLESSLDHLLISLNCIDEESAQSTYGRMEDWKKLLDMAFFLIKECTDLDLILEVCTVVTRKNINSVFQIGEKILTCNPHAYWRVDEYYPNGEVKDRENGRDSALCKEFKLSDGRFELLKNEVKMHFPAQVKNSKIRFNSRRDREKAPDVMLTPTGKLVTSSESIYEQAENPDLRTHSFANRRPYEEYKSYCRFWSWDTQCDLQGYSGKDDFKEWYQCLGKKEIHG